MIKKIENKKMGKGNSEWLKTNYHFSFADYYDPNNLEFGFLCVLNDDIIAPKSGFDMHPHRNMEIITYVIAGELTHEDSDGHKSLIKRGELQYMSAGRGIYHSEYNHSDKPLHLLQIWIKPDQNNLPPAYGESALPFEKRLNQWLKLVSSKSENNAPVTINQQASVYVTLLESGKTLAGNIDEDEIAYLIQIEGRSVINRIELNPKDAMEILSENIVINATENSHIMLIKMKKQ